MGHDQTQRVSVVGRERLTVMLRGEQHIITVEIDQRNIECEPLLRQYQNVLCLGFESNKFEDFPESHTLPVIVKAAPARHAVKITSGFDPGQTTDIVPAQPQRL